MSAGSRAVPNGPRQHPRWGFARVRGESMAPTLRPGDRLLVDYRREPRPGDLVVARLPDGAVVAKRAVERRTTRRGLPAWWLLSDNASEGVDSRHHGAIPVGDVRGVVVMRMWPWRRPGAVPDSPGA